MTCVVHYQVPAALDVYVHRCGRTARAEAEGISVALVTPKEAPRFAALLKVRPPALQSASRVLVSEDGCLLRKTRLLACGTSLQPSSLQGMEKHLQRKVCLDDVKALHCLLQALDRDAPPLFPLDHNLLAGAKRRVRLATRLEERLRLSSKQSADHSWRAQAAEAAGIELSDEEDAGGNANNGAVQALQEVSICSVLETFVWRLPLVERHASRC